MEIGQSPQIQPAARTAVLAAASGTARGVLYSEPIIDMAAVLLTDLWAAAGQHGIGSAEVNLAEWCLSAIDKKCCACSRAADGARALLAVLVEECAQAGVAAFLTPGRGMVVLPRGPRTPTWGYREPPQLAVTVLTDGLPGWYLAMHPTGALLGRVVAPYDRSGAAAMARLAITVNAGERGS